MRFNLTEDTWTLDFLTPPEWHLIAELPTTAAGKGFRDESKERLYPSHLAPTALADESTISSVDDWQDFVQPEIESGFKEARSVVERDLALVEMMPLQEMLPPDQYETLKDELPSMRQLTIANEHADAWYSALNQARLLLNEEYDIANSEERLLLENGQVDEIDPDRMLIFSQYTMYSSIQSLLIETIMNPS